MKAEIKFLYLCVHVFLIFAFLVRPCYAENKINQKNLSLREKVGQLFIIRPESLNTAKTLEQINDNYKYGDVELNNLMRENLKKYPAGGFIIYGKNINDPEQLKKFVSDLKNSSSVIPFIAIDEEGGRIARIANHKKFNVKKFKSAEAVGKTENVKNAFNMAEYISSYLSEYGFNFNFAPVADVNTNPENIVIGDRAFSSNPETVSKMVSSYLDGLHANKILGCIKHFPGHGDTKGDTHSGYVAIYKTWDELLKNEIIPFKNNLNKTDSIMTAHITLKNVTSDDLPATLSREIITDKLRGELKYNGVIICDALSMGAIHDNYNSGLSAVLAIEAGCDILLMPYDYIEAFEMILNAVESGRISEARLNESVNRILKLKGG